MTALHDLIITLRKELQRQCRWCLRIDLGFGQTWLTITALWKHGHTPFERSYKIAWSTLEHALNPNALIEELMKKLLAAYHSTRV